MGLTRKEREKEEENERKAAEKAAKKAELAAKRAARDAEKAAKAASAASAAAGADADKANDAPGADADDAHAGGWTADESEALVRGIRANPRGSHATEQARWEAISGATEGLDAHRDALACVAHYKSLLGKLRAIKSIKKVGPAKKRENLAKKREAEELQRQKKAAQEAKLAEARRLANGGRLDAEELGFFIRSGPDANRRANANMDIQIGGIQLYGGKQELLTDATLKLVHGTKYGLVGRNGTGKSTLLHAISDRVVPMPDHLHIIHVEQEAAPSHKSALPCASFAASASPLMVSIALPQEAATPTSAEIDRFAIRRRRDRSFRPRCGFTRADEIPATCEQKKCEPTAWRVAPRSYY